MQRVCWAGNPENGIKFGNSVVHHNHILRGTLLSGQLHRTLHCPRGHVVAAARVATIRTHRKPGRVKTP